MKSDKTSKMTDPATEQREMPGRPTTRQDTATNSHENAAQENSIAACESEAETAREQAHQAETREQWDDYEYYMDIVEQSEQKANDIRYGEGHEHENGKGAGDA